jgi:hypothetical protein
LEQPRRPQDGALLVRLSLYAGQLRLANIPLDADCRRTGPQS